MKLAKCTCTLSPKLGQIIMLALSNHKAFLIAAFGLLAFYAKGQVESSLLQKSWVAVESRSISDQGYSPIDGMLLHFTNSEVEISRVGSDTLVSASYKVDRNKVIVEDTADFFQVLHLSRDSLKVQIGKNMEVLMLPLSSPRLSIHLDTLTNQLCASSWNRKQGKWKDRIEFEEPEVSKKQSQRNFFLRQHRGKYGFERYFEFWALSKFHGHVLLGLSHGQTDWNIYQIEKINWSKIKSNHLAPYGNVKTVFELVRPIHTRKLEELKDIITSKPWNVERLDYHHFLQEASETQGFELDTSMSSGFGLINDTLILKHDFFTEKLAYQFYADKSYVFSAGSKTSLKGLWSLSLDGKFIVLEKNNGSKEYLEVLQAESDKLILGQTFSLRVSPEKSEWVDYDCTLEMK